MTKQESVDRIIVEIDILEQQKSDIEQRIYFLEILKKDTLEEIEFNSPV